MSARSVVGLLTVGALFAALGLSAGCAAGDGAVGAATRPAGGDWGGEVRRIVAGPDEIVTVLENGMTVIARRVDSPAASVRCYVRAGGVYEGKWLGGGLSHLLEHLVAGGTNARRSEEENRNLLQRLGNNSNAYTTYEFTQYFVNTTPDLVEEAIDLVSGWVLTAKITPQEYRREYEVVQRELQMNRGDADRTFFLMSMANRYHHSPARVPVVGHQEVIRGLSRDDVYEYYRLAYQPNNMVFAVAADRPAEELVAAVRRHVGGFPPGREFDRRISPEPPVVSPRTMAGTMPDIGQAKLEVAFPTVDLLHEDLYALDLLAMTLGQGESSLLAEEIRDRRQLASSVSAWNWTPSFVEGTFSIVLETDPDKLKEAKAAVLEVVRGLREKGVDAARLERAKAQARAQRAFGQQRAEDVIDSMAQDFLSTGDVHFGKRYVERLQAVTPQQVREAARKYLDEGRLLATALLPAGSAEATGLARAEELLRAAARPGEAATSRPAVAADAAVRRSVLSNGTVLLTRRIAHAPVVSVQLYALGGLAAENESNNGIGNLAMRTSPRGAAGRSAQQIAEFFDSIGGEVSASCGNNTWSWSMDCLRDDLAAAMEVFADIVAEPRFEAEEVDSMRRRTLAAIDGQDADAFSAGYRFLRSVYFAEGLAYRFMPLGRRETVEKLTAADLGAWYRTKVLTAPRVVAVYGDVEADRARDLAERALGRLPKVPAPPAAPPPPSVPSRAVDDGAAGPATPAVSVREVHVKRGTAPLASVFVAFDSMSVVGRDVNAAIDVADTMASGWGYPTGYIFETLRGAGLVYDAQAFDFRGVDAARPGAFIVYAGCEPQNVNAVVDKILMNMARLQGTEADMQKGWLERSRRLIVTSAALDRETAQQQAQGDALDELLGLGYRYHEGFADKIDKVVVEDVRRAARRWLSGCVVAVTTPQPQQVNIWTGERTYKDFAPVDLTPGGVEHPTPGVR